MPTSETLDASSYDVQVDRLAGGMRLITCDALGIREEFHGSYACAKAYGRQLVERHLREHGAQPIERPRMTDAERDEVFGGY